MAFQTPPEFKLRPLSTHIIIHWQDWQHSNILLKHSNLHLQHSCQAFKIHSQHSKDTQSFNQLTETFKAGMKNPLTTLDMHFKQAIIQFQLSFRTFVQFDFQFKHSFILLEHSVRIFNPNIQFEHSIRKKITFNSKIQFKHSIIQFEHSIPTFNPNQLKLCCFCRPIRYLHIQV